ncbi:MAG: hypothetical protein LBD58_04620 [Treponema sp.]|jgi:hypothetical protein|nr:hypothetical protein [Treponema sp.]
MALQAAKTKSGYIRQNDPAKAEDKTLKPDMRVNALSGELSQNSGKNLEKDLTKK